MNSVREIASVLKVALNSEALFSLVNTRITLRTGIDLSSPDLAARDTPANAEHVLGVLKAIGYSLESLQRVAERAGAGAAASRPPGRT